MIEALHQKQERMAVITKEHNEKTNIKKDRFFPICLSFHIIQFPFLCGIDAHLTFNA